MSAEGKISFAKTVKKAMTDNAAVFTNPNPSMTELGAGITEADALEEAYKAALVAVTAALTARDAQVEAVCGLLNQEAGYVQSKSAGDPAIIELAGMGVMGAGTPVGPMPQVLHLAVSAGDHDGTVDAMWDPIYGAKSFEVWTSADPMSETSWKFALSSGKSSVTLKGLTSGSKVWVRVRAIGADPEPGPWSDPAVKTVP
jgi:hypothetical protein